MYNITRWEVNYRSSDEVFMLFAFFVFQLFFTTTTGTVLGKIFVYIRLYTADSKMVIFPKPQTMNYERARDAGCRLKWTN